MEMEPTDKIASFLAGTSSPQERKELEAWRNETPANEEDFCRFKRVWEAAGPAENFCPNVDKAWQKVNACLFQKEATHLQPTLPKTVPLYRKPWAIAAAVALFVLGSGVFIFLNQNASFIPGASIATIETGENEKQQISLPDGSQIWLNENSSISYPERFEGKLREVKFEGEGYFEVAHNPEKPFTIVAGEGIIEVLGTAFNLEVHEEVKVQVSSGRVKLSANDKASAGSLILEKGDAALLKNEALKEVKPNPNFLAWKTGEFVFENTTLQEVVQSLEKYYGIEIKVSPEIRQCRLFSRFQQQPLEEVLKVLSLTLQLQDDYQPGKKVVSLSPLHPSNTCFTANP